MKALGWYLKGEKVYVVFEDEIVDYQLVDIITDWVDRNFKEE